MAKGEATSRRTSVRLRLMLPIAAAIAGVLALGTIQVGGALQTNSDAAHATVLADLTTSTAKILHVGQDEVAATAQSNADNGDSYGEELDDAKDRTDEFIEKFVKSSKDVRKQVPELRAVLITAEGAASEIETARETLDQFAQGEGNFSDPEVTHGLEVYQSIAHRVLDVADALPNYIADPELAQQARALSSLAGAKQAAGDQRFVVGNLMSASSSQPDVTNRLAQYTSVRDERLGEFYRAANPRAKGLYATTVNGPPVQRSTEIVTMLLAGKTPDYSRGDWEFAQSSYVDKLHQVETQLAEDLGDSAAHMESQAQQDAIVTGAFVLAVAGLAFATATLLALQISRRLRRLRRNALTTAEETLPNAVAEMTEARSEKQVNDAVFLAESATVLTEKRRSSDEVGAVTQAFDLVNRRALRLAADQALLQLDVAAMMIALARRGQSLVQRQLQMLEEFAEIERDPEGRRRLRTLNHLASRMRRNEENLLLLAGGDPGRRHNHAATAATTVAEAAAAIEDSDRVVIEDSGSARIAASAVGDVVHLLAELLENAALFSPPNTAVRVGTRHTVHELVISVQDEGIGLTPEQVEEINERLAEPSGLTSSLAGTMGLLVVARLAARHNIDVQLHSTSSKGTLAVVRIPDTLVEGEGYGAVPQQPRSGMPADELPTTGSPLALTAEPSAGPQTGTGDPSTGSNAIIVPDAHRGASIDAAAPASSRPSVGTGSTPATPAGQTGWFMPATGSGDSPSQPPGSLSWRSAAGDIAYDQAREAIASQHQSPANGGYNVNDGNLPQRRPGARLLPGSVSGDDPSPNPGGGADNEALDPDEVRTRLSGFAGGIAAAESSGTDNFR